jgi:hypothetical protein
MPVFPTEPTSAVAFFLTSPMYHNQLQQMRAEVFLEASAARASSSAAPVAPSSASDVPRAANPGPPSDVVVQTPRSVVADTAGTASASFSRPPSPPHSFSAETSPLPSIACTTNPSFAATDNPLGLPLDFSYPVSTDSTAPVPPHHHSAASQASSARLEEGCSGPSRSSPDAHKAGNSADTATIESEVRLSSSSACQRLCPPRA